MSPEIHNPFERGPYVQLAAFCERTLREGDGVLSLIRVVDVITHSERGSNPPDIMPEFHYPLTLVISFKSGTARGRHEIAIIPEQPSGETLPPAITSVNFEGEGKGANIVSRLDIPYRYEGLYWFSVLINNQLITRVPLEVRYTRTITAPPTGNP